MEPDTQKIVFTIPEESSVIDLIYEILEENGLKETPHESVEKSLQKQISRSNAVRDAIWSLAEKKDSEENITLLLQKQLEIIPEKAEKIINDLKQKIIPYAKKWSTVNTTSTEMTNNENSRTSFVKKPSIENVEKNEKTIEQKKEIIKNSPSANSNLAKTRRGKKSNTEQIQKSKGSDSYRESI